MMRIPCSVCVTSGWNWSRKTASRDGAWQQWARCRLRHNLKIRGTAVTFLHGSSRHPTERLHCPGDDLQYRPADTARDDVNLRKAKFGFIGGLNPAAKFLGHGLHAVADAGIGKPAS